MLALNNTMLHYSAALQFHDHFRSSEINISSISKFLRTNLPGPSADRAKNVTAKNILHTINQFASPRVIHQQANNLLSFFPLPSVEVSEEGAEQRSIIVPRRLTGRQATSRLSLARHLIVELVVDVEVHTGRKLSEFASVASVPGVDLAREGISSPAVTRKV